MKFGHRVSSVTAVFKVVKMIKCRLSALRESFIQIRKTVGNRAVLYASPFLKV